ncbi:hypothetical protein DEU56DRAFT_942303 [Suillus clintonianus]|uniref:uncharacterized protein n=1 Tax=Suillus clintonianus TaxID=1904413 RepID=UPI001B86400B|nr:uncharacterized protein DEU56DRAFT_942303 [Suillus clintonianus]KAG2139675.1 hypothetical protein DEU56DRAFT_942303 [Suillus clintonianus]
MPAIPIQLIATPCRVCDPPKAHHSPDFSGRIVYLIYGWTDVVVFPMLCVILITRLHAMYQRSTRILIFLVVVSLPINIFDVVANAIVTRHDSGEELILSGTYACTIDYADNFSLVNSISWILSTVWEVLAMCLAVWIAVKHFRELRQHSAGGIIGDCFTVLIKSHVFYFASFAAVSCFSLVINLSPTILANPFSLETQIVIGVAQILQVIQCYVLGPRLILSLREYHARLVADSDAATGMTSIAFQERVQISTGSECLKETGQGTPAYINSILSWLCKFGRKMRGTPVVAVAHGWDLVDGSGRGTWAPLLKPRTPTGQLNLLAGL